MRHASARIRGVAGALILLLTLSFGAAPLAAAEAGPTLPAPKPLTASAAAVVAKLDTSSAVAPTQAGAPAEQGSKHFFATPKGIAALVIFAGLTAYTIHTRIKDHVHSPIR